MRKISLIALLFILTSGAVAAQMLPEPKGGQTIYVVRPGDTLWDISERFFDNPLLWPRLWELNPYIDNPNLIYPGDVITLEWRPNIPVVKVNPEAKEQEIVAPAPPPPVYFYSPGGGEGFVSPDEWEHMGTVVSSEPPKILLGEGDTIYVNVGAEDGVSRGDKFTVFRTGKQVLHPLTGRRIGYKVAILGEIEIDHVVGEELSAAEVIYSYREITRGARVRPIETFVKEVVMKRGREKKEGIVVETLDNTELMGRGDVFYIDIGRDEDIAPGNLFSIYKYPRNAFDPDKGELVTIPGAVVGRAIALKVAEESTTCVVIESSRQIEKGDVVSLELES